MPTSAQAESLPNSMNLLRRDLRKAKQVMSCLVSLHSQKIKALLGWFLTALSNSSPAQPPPPAVVVVVVVACWALLRLQLLNSALAFLSPHSCPSLA